MPLTPLPHGITILEVGYTPAPASGGGAPPDIPGRVYPTQNGNYLRIGGRFLTARLKEA